MKIRKTKIKEGQKGITLIALVVTIVILIILATISINAVFGENGLIKMAEKAKVINAIKEKEEEVQFAITELTLENNGNASKVTVSAVVDKVKQNYKDQKSKNSISGASNVEGEDTFPGYIQYDPPSSTVDQTIVVNVDENLNVSASASEPSAEIKPPKSEYTKTENVYYNTPDVSGFNPENTYYVVYDKDGKNEAIYGRMDKVKAPGTETEEDEVPEKFKDMVWHDYGKKMWANVVTVNGNDVTYWTWIPRYVYSIPENQTSGQEKADIKFIDSNGNYINGETDQVDNSKISGYTLPESFKFANKENINGYWMTKYELQNTTASGGATGIEKLIVTGEDKTLNVTTSKPNGKYTIYLYGEIYKENTELPIKITGLNSNKDYEITLYNETDKRMIGSAIGKIPISTSVIKVDLSGFNPDCTYYITYDENGENEKLGDRIQLDESGKAINIPDNWYNYEKKIWANLVTVNGNDVTYWTYIPRYEYATYPYEDKAQIRFIPETQVEPSPGYQIPESFTFADKQLAGYWMTKYELQNTTASGGAPGIEKLIVTGEDKALNVTTSNPEGKKYTVYLNKELYKEKGLTLPLKIENLDSNISYEVTVYNETDKKMIGSALGKVPSSTSAIKVDLSGFNPDCTYYVEYDSEGNEINPGPELENIQLKTKIHLNDSGEPTNMPTNWYNYDEKKWANIVTVNGDQITYWTYIPRYEYATYPYEDKAQIRFIPETKVEASPEYKIPESFTFAGKQLKGYWITKYELQNK